LNLRAFVAASFILAAAPVAAQEPRLPPPAHPDATLESLSTGSPDAPIEARVQGARLLSLSNKYRESAQAWADVGAREPLLLSFSEIEAGRALLDAGDLQGALDVLALLKSAAPADVLLRAAGGARANRMLDRATELYTQARKNAGRSLLADQAALELAATFEQAGNPRDALDVFRELQLTFRQVTAYDAAEAGAKRLASQVTGSEPLTEQDYEAISDRLEGVAAFRRAVEVLTEWRAAFPESTHVERIELSLIQDLYALRANDEARQRAEAFLKARPDSSKYASAYRTLFSLDAREGRTDDVERRGGALLRGEVKGVTLDQRQGAGRLLAEYLVSIGEAKRAVTTYDQLLAITKSRGERIDLLWRTAIAALRTGNRARAIRDLKQVRTLKLDSETDRATAYWLATSLAAEGTKDEARTVATTLVERYPYSYYGAKAASEFSVKAPAPSVAFPALTLSDTLLAHSDYKTAAILSRAGLAAEAAFYARRLSTTFRRDEAAALLAARASEAAGEPSSASTIMTSFFGDYLERPVRDLPEDFWRLAYPPAYWGEVSAAAARHHVDPLLMLALARQESHFDRTIKSPVGAIGLFQIMPATAAELDPTFDSAHAEEQLVKAAVAAELAATLLERQLNRFKGQLAPAIASYNADQERVQVWWDAARGASEAIFVDSIPYRETRGYVRQVLANYAMYQRAAAPPPSPQK